MVNGSRCASSERSAVLNSLNFGPVRSTSAAQRLLNDWASMPPPSKRFAEPCGYRLNIRHNRNHTIFRLGHSV
jgi:hypothetical protein